MQGIEVYNNNNRLIISPDYKNYSIVEKGVISNFGTLLEDSLNSLVLVRPSGGTGVVYGSSVGTKGAHLVDRPYDGNYYPLTDAIGSRVKSSTGYVEYVILKVNPPASASKNGLVVFGADGAIVFDSYYSGACPTISFQSSLENAKTNGPTNLSGLPALLSGRERYVTSASLFIHNAAANTANTKYVYHSSYAKFISSSSVEVGWWYETDEWYKGVWLSWWTISKALKSNFAIFDA